jgi:hypothetical protein
MTTTRLAVTQRTALLMGLLWFLMIVMMYLGVLAAAPL